MKAETTNLTSLPLCLTVVEIQTRAQLLLEGSANNIIIFLISILHHQDYFYLSCFKINHFQIQTISKFLEKNEFHQLSAEYQIQVRNCDFVKN